MSEKTIAPRACIGGSPKEGDVKHSTLIDFISRSLYKRHDVSSLSSSIAKRVYNNFINIIDDHMYIGMRSP